MFKRGTPEGEQQLETIIGHSVRVEGDFESHGDVTIEGNLTGSIKTKGILTIGNKAIIQANITAESVHISGIVKGNIHAKNKVTLEKSARVEGDIVATVIAIEEGSYFMGNCAMAQQEEPLLKEREVKETPHEVRVRVQS